jgi:formylglycine-generating enzyme
VSFSEPAVARLINGAFVPVLVSMHLRGPAADDVGRDFVLKQPPSGNFELYPPDLFVVSPEKEVLGRLGYDASAQATLNFLKDILRKRPDLAPPVGLDSFDPPPPAEPLEIALKELERRYNATTPDEQRWREREEARFDDNKASLVPELERWLTQYGDRRTDAEANARLLLAGARYHAGNVEGATAMWRSVLELYPGHPLRHRAEYNLIEPEAFPTLPHPELAQVPPPSLVKLGIIVPDPEVRARNMDLVRTDPKYIHLRPGLPFVRVPAGTFTMGGTPAVQFREVPTRTVTVSKPYLMSAWPVTRELWALLRPETYPGAEREGLAAQLPATHIPWTDAVAFAEFLSEHDGRRYRLPTEAEWEYAARGGLEGKQYPWGDEDADPTRCNYSNPRPVPVACYPPNGYGLFDSVGNNYEWTADYYLKDAYARTPPEVVDPTGPSAELVHTVNGDPGDMARVLRGGGWLGNVMSKINCRNSWRIGWPEGFHWGNLGVRLVTDAD